MSDNVCEVIARTTYDLKIGGVVHQGFELKSEWEGFAKLEDKDGRVAILQQQAYDPRKSPFGPAAPFSMNVVVAADSILKAKTQEQSAEADTTKKETNDPGKGKVGG